MKKLAFLIFCVITFINTSYATHNRAGEITFKCDSLNPFKYYFTITTYTKADSQADRCSLTVYFCDMNDSAIFFRVNGNNGVCPQPAKMGELIGNNIRKNIYKGEHVFSSSVLSCRIMMQDPNRNSDIVNIPNSVNQPFFIVSTLSINPLIGSNSSPILLNPPIENACFCKKFIHNPGAYDPDGDSLSYRLITPFSNSGLEVSCYSLPVGVQINPVNGDLIWECPGTTSPSNCGGSITGAGEYNFAILIEEWRNGQLIGSVERDMQVTVQAGCNNNPPVVEARDTCVVAGNILNMLVKAYDTPIVVGNITQIDNVSLSATGAPLILTNSPAQFPTVGGAPIVNSLFTWNTICNHVKKNPYRVTFKANDSNASNSLSDSKTINIKVVGPSPILVSATPIANTIKLDWLSYACTNAVGYKIYRKLGCSSLQFDVCETGIPASSGYSLIATIDDINTLFLIDDENGAGLLYGQEYSYRIIAFFEDGAESKASNDRCAKLKRDAPIITNISIYETDSLVGKDTLRWCRPTQFDSITQFPPPYKYVINRRIVGDADFAVIDSTSSINDTLYLLDTKLNTLQKQYEYRIDFYTKNNRILIGKSNNATSLRIDTIANDKSITLNFKYSVPWVNDTFFVYREKIGIPNVYELKAITSQKSYIDFGLTNNKNYCYRVLSKGRYTDSTIVKPLYNMSQKICATPIDRTPPCAPKLSALPDCINYQNTFSWINTNLTCANDIVKYHIYYSSTQNSSMNVLKAIFGVENLSWVHILDSNSIAGCYSITAIDSSNNESKNSDTICIDNCPEYRLPNVFTPNSDNSNDFFIPFPYKFVKDVNMYIYDRWGVLVFETNNPNIGWNGKHFKTQEECDDGVFYYICTVNEVRLKGITPRVIKGFIQKISTDKNSKAN